MVIMVALSLVVLGGCRTSQALSAVQTELGTDVAGTASDLKTRLAVSVNNDGTIKPQLGSWVDKSGGYAAQQAATDGFVCVYGTSTGADFVATGYTDVNSTPTTIRAAANGTHTYPTGFMMPVKKGDYWKVVLTSGTTIAVYWIPLCNV